MRRVAARSEVTPFYVMEVLRAAREVEARGGVVSHLEVGQPSTGAPATAVAAARAALDRPETLGYTDATGTAELRRRIARHYRDTDGLDVDPGRVVVTVGASVGCLLTFVAAFEPGDRVGVLEPGYPCYRQMLGALGVEPVPISVGAPSRYQPTPELLDAAGPLDGLVIASPANPTGSVLHDDELDRLMGWCDAHDVRLVADEIYRGITFGRPSPTAAAHPQVAPVVVNSFSKYFSMTGWRLGWLVLPEELVRPVELLAQNLVIAPSTISQVAALAAFDGIEELDGHVARYATNRDVVVAGLAALGCHDVAPAEGAFYAYADVAHLLRDGGPATSTELCRRWLSEAGVATTPGIDFDPRRGDRTVRWSFAGATDDVTAAMGRLRDWVDARA